MNSFYTHFSIQKGKLFVKEVTESGQRLSKKVDINPSVYIPEPSIEPYDQKTLKGVALREMSFDTFSDLKDFVSVNEGSMELYGYPRQEYNAINKMFPGDSLEFNFSQINIGIFDIETECENGFPDPSKAVEAVNAITLYYKDVYYVYSTFDYDSDDPQIKFNHFDSEFDLLRGFLKDWVSFDLDIISGWNSEFFDIPYIYNRMKNVLGEKTANKLSPINRCYTKSVRTQYGPRETVVIVGVESLDFQLLYKKFTYVTRPSYKLDYIAHVELGEQKIDYSEEGGQLHLLYLKNPKKFIDYNIHDVRLLVRLEEKLKLIFLATIVAYRMKVNYSDVFGQVRMWEVKLSNYMQNRNIQPEYESSGKKSEKFEGAYVKVPIQGYYKHVVSFDLTSLYPHILMQYNMSPETMMGPTSEFIGGITNDAVAYDDDRMDKIKADLLDQNICMAANGSTYTKEFKGIAPEVVESVFDERVVAKKQMIEAKKEKQNLEQGSKEYEYWDQKVVEYNNQQLAAKIQINSLYGALGNEFFKWFNLYQAHGITASGQAAIKWIDRKINEFLNKTLDTKDVDYVIYCDTDSAYVNIEPYINHLLKKKGKTVDDFSNNKVIDLIDKIAETKIIKVIDDAYQEFAERTNAYENKMDMKREVIGAAVFVAKKRYTMRIYDDEGARLPSPKMKIMGHEAVRSQYPDWCRRKMTEGLEMMFTATSEKVASFMEETRNEYMSQSPDDAASSSGVNGLDKYTNPAGTSLPTLCARGAQSHVRGSIYYNHLIQELGMEKTHEPIRDGDKVKILLLNKRICPLGIDVIAYKDSLPKEFGLDDYVDLDEMFNKNFKEPMRRVYDVVGLRTEKKMSLRDRMKMNKSN